MLTTLTAQRRSVQRPTNRPSNPLRPLHHAYVNEGRAGRPALTGPARSSSLPLDAATTRQAHPPSLLPIEILKRESVGERGCRGRASGASEPQAKGGPYGPDERGDAVSGANAPDRHREAPPAAPLTGGRLKKPQTTP